LVILIFGKRKFPRESDDVFRLEIYIINGTASLNESKLVDKLAQRELLEGDWIHLKTNILVESANRKSTNSHY
jgi:hypothetical protein